MDFQPVTEFLDQVEERFGVPACECIVWRDHRPLYRHWVGRMEWSKDGAPLRGGEWYWLYSATKLATMTSAMQLWEQGRLRLDDPVARYLPEYAHLTVREGGTIRPARTELTVRHLMTMTGGFSYDQTLPSILAAREKGAGTRELIRMLAAEPLRFDPGTRFLYSMCHDIMAAVIEVVSGERFSDYVQDHIAAPLGIDGITFRPSQDQIERMPVQIRWYEGEHAMRPVGRGNHHQLTPAYDSGGAGICCRAVDYIRFVDALACGGVGANGGRILRPETIRVMRTNQLTGQALRDYHGIGKPEDEGYALGVRVQLRDGDVPAGEFGWDGAAGALAIAEPRGRLSVFYASHVLGYQVNYSQIHPELLRRIHRCVDSAG